MDPGGYMRRHRPWKHEGFYTLTPFSQTTHIKESSPAGEDGDTFRSRLGVSGPVGGLCFGAPARTSPPLSAGCSVESGATTAWRTLAPPPNLRTSRPPDRATLTDPSLGPRCVCQQGLKTIFQTGPGEGGGVDLETRGIMLYAFSLH